LWIKEQLKLHRPASLLILTTIVKEFHLCCTQTRERDRGTEAIYNFTFLHIPASEKTAEIQIFATITNLCDTKVIMNQVSKKAISTRQQHSRILPGHACKNIRSSIFPKKAVVIIILDSMEDK
jgi:hypothetical protein